MQIIYQTIIKNIFKQKLINQLTIKQVNQVQDQQKMFRSFSRLPIFRYSESMESTYAMKYRVKDITKLRGMGTKEPYIMIEKQKINISKTNLIANVIAQSPFFTPNFPIRITFLDLQQNTYLPACPALALLQSSFYVKVNNDMYYVANQQPLIKGSTNAQFIATDASPHLEPIIGEILNDVGNIPESITPANLQSLITKAVIDKSSLYKMEKIRLKQLLKILNERISSFQLQIAQINQEIVAKSIKKTRLFSSFMIAQYAFMHYLIYYHLSWDIMEPITVILTNLDLLVGYYFFVLKGKEYSLEGIQKDVQQRKKLAYLKKFNFNLEKYEELLQLKQYFELRLNLLSKNPHNIMDAIQKPIKLLDTRL